MISNLIKTKKIFNTLELGQNCFYIGTVLLATTNFFAGIFYLISLIISFTKKNTVFKKDFWNISLIFCSIVFILSSINISIIQNSTPIYRVLKEYSWNPYSVWLSLFNWIPLFLAFFGFQIYLQTEKDRMKFAKCIFIGLIPVILSIFLQTLNIFGPFEYLNGLVIFYLKPIDNLGGFSGLFNNPNYTGIWLSAALPFCFLILKSQKYKKIKYSFILTIIISTIYFILITNSRNAFMGIIISTSLMISTKFMIISLLLVGFMYFIVFGLSTLPFLGSLGIQEFLPNRIFIKILQTNYFSKLQFSRIDIWMQALNLISERPLLGWGASTFPILYVIRGGIENAQHTHSMPLEIAQTNGIPAALILMSFVAYLFLKAWKVIFIKNKSLESQTNKAWIISVFIIIISHLSDITYYDGRISLFIWILLAGLKCILDEDETTNKLRKI